MNFRKFSKKLFYCLFDKIIIIYNDLMRNLNLTVIENPKSIFLRFRYTSSNFVGIQSAFHFLWESAAREGFHVIKNVPSVKVY
jgi:hypothetical protein